MVKPGARSFIPYFIRLGFLVVKKNKLMGVLTRYIKLWSLNKGMKE
jgi:hypothetical protein